MSFSDNCFPRLQHASAGEHHSVHPLLRGGPQSRRAQVQRGARPLQARHRREPVRDLRRPDHGESELEH